MISILKLLRPSQWIKNLFLFIPVFFAGKIADLDKIQVLIGGFAIFSLAASSIYVLNDLRDVESDRLHPTKKNRPIASGTVSSSLAIVLFLLLAGGSLGLSALISIEYLYFILAYIFINIMYSLGLKHVPILDLFIVSIGFLIRVLSGGIIVDVPVSQWTIIMVLLLSLFLVMGKRLHDLVLAEEQNVAPRRSSSSYSINFVHASLTMLSAIMVVSYIMYTVSEEVKVRFDTEYLYLTSIFVIAGILRYLQIALVEKDSGSPTAILYNDRFILITVLGWIVSFILILYS